MCSYLRVVCVLFVGLGEGGKMGCGGLRRKGTYVDGARLGREEAREEAVLAGRPAGFVEVAGYHAVVARPEAELDHVALLGVDDVGFEVQAILAD